MLAFTLAFTHALTLALTLAFTLSEKVKGLFRSYSLSDAFTLDGGWQECSRN